MEDNALNSHLERLVPNFALNCNNQASQQTLCNEPDDPSRNILAVESLYSGELLSKNQQQNSHRLLSPDDDKQSAMTYAQY